MEVFFYYVFSSVDGFQTQPVLLRCSKGLASRTSQVEEDLTEIELEWTRDTLLSYALERTGFQRHCLMGYCELSLEGDELYSEKGGFPINFWYAETKYGKPWIVISQAETAEDFFRIIEEDDDMKCMNPNYPKYPYPSQNIAAILYTEQDFELCSEEIEQKASRSKKMIKECPEICMRYLFLSSFLEEGWIFEQVYDWLELKKEDELYAIWEHSDPNLPNIVVSYNQSKNILKMSFKYFQFLNEFLENGGQLHSFSFDCSTKEEMKVLIKMILKYKHFLYYDRDRKVKGYEELILALEEQNIKACRDE